MGKLLSFLRRRHATSDVRAVFSEDGLAVFDLTTGALFRSNFIGAQIWRGLVEKHQDEVSIAVSLSERYGIPLSQAVDDVTSFVEQLRREGLVNTQ